MTAEPLLSTQCCNALKFGSETCGTVTNYHFSHIVITAVGRQALAWPRRTARISGVYYNDRAYVAGREAAP